MRKSGGKKCSDSSFIPFNTMFHNCGLLDFPYKGNPFSWVGRRRNGLVKCRLDRAIGNEDWHSMLSHTNVEYLKLWSSDHRPILIHVESHTNKVRRNFMFDKRWLGKDRFEDTGHSGWRTSSLGEDPNFVKRIQLCRRSISQWRKDLNSNSAKRIKELTEKLDVAQEDESLDTPAITQLKWELCDAFREEEIFWHQKSRAT